MKNLFLFFALVFTTSLVSAQDLTPDMLVGEYEGTTKVLYNGTTNPREYKKQKVSISKKEGGDTLVIKIQEDNIYHESNLIIDGENIVISGQKFKDFNNGLTKNEIIKNYDGDKIESIPFGKYDSKKEIFILSFVIKIEARGTVNKDSYKHFYLNVKKL